MEEKNIQDKLVKMAFSEREIKTIQMMGNDCSREEIATEFGQSIRTVETRIYQLKKKLGVKTSVGLVVFFYKNGWIE